MTAWGGGLADTVDFPHSLLQYCIFWGNVENYSSSVQEDQLAEFQEQFRGLPGAGAGGDGLVAVLNFDIPDPTAVVNPMEPLWSRGDSIHLSPSACRDLTTAIAERLTAVVGYRPSRGLAAWKATRGGGGVAPLGAKGAGSRPTAIPQSAYCVF